jgi:hypothetical protein
LAAEDETVWKETKQDGFWKVHYGFAVDIETSSSKVQGETGEKRGLYVGLYGSLRYLSDDSSHGSGSVFSLQNGRFKAKPRINLSDISKSTIKINK